MKRSALPLILLLAVFLAVPLAAPSPARAAALPPQLRSAVTLEGDTLHLGDLWDNLGDKAKVVVAAAPQPGRHITLEARWLAAVADANGIDWHPSSPFDRVVVERAGQPVDPALIETNLREALNLEGMPAESSFEISNRENLHILVPAGSDPSVAVREANYDPRTHRFSAVIEAPAGAPDAVRVRVSGRTYANTRIPVLTRAMARGETIGEHDVEWKEVREESVHQDTIIEMRQLVGMEPRYHVGPGVPVRLSDLERPMVVTRNSDVTIVLRTPYMVLTAMGRAMDAGGRGDIVKVVNLQTKQIVDARVEGPSTVVVTPASARAVIN